MVWALYSDRQRMTSESRARPKIRDNIIRMLILWRREWRTTDLGIDMTAKNVIFFSEINSLFQKQSQARKARDKSRGLFRENGSLLSQQKCNIAWGKQAHTNNLRVLLKGLDRGTSRWVTLKFQICMQKLRRPESDLKAPSPSDSMTEMSELVWRKRRQKAKKDREASILLLGEGEFNGEITLAFLKQFKVFSVLWETA